MTPSIYADADELLDAFARRDQLRRELAELAKAALAKGEELDRAEAEIARVRSRLGASLGVA